MHTSMVLTALLPSASLIHAQKVFINKVPAYSSLPSCAVEPLSTIVRNMEQGCGDGGKTTSFSCFCTASFSKMESKISKAVDNKCGAQTVTAGVEMALGVFESYCAMGGNATISSVPASTTTNLNVTVVTTSASVTPSASGNGTASLSFSSSGPTITSAPAGPAGSSSAAVPLSTGGAGTLKGCPEMRVAVGIGALLGALGIFV
ncbi:hypothetical protein BCR34DRAFT_597188 [Clohesyomyces aquaticus]|uniref:Uncharacterized protein n=1 Tax=Clohesyomyces aquaticus TaxID=1231657 RepID=A0A1Y2A3L0_9PLEO|nr:hypothetical protein BCR34DRAFT_597188 [Clohesyomyces aquaticus]